MNGQCSVLVVDPSEETREVLQTVLERRGLRTLTAGRSAAGLELARQHRPDLIVLDLELGDVEADAFSDSQPDDRPRMVLLGNLRGWRNRLPNGEFMAKPYHYGSLIRKIEELLAEDAPSRSMGCADALCHSRSRSGDAL